MELTLNVLRKIIRFLVPEFTVDIMSSINEIIDFQTRKTKAINEPSLISWQINSEVDCKIDILIKRPSSTRLNTSTKMKII